MVETLITTVEAGLTRILHLALGWRHPAVADQAALVATPVEHLPSGALVFVTSDSNLWEWDPDSEALVSALVLQSTQLPPTARGRWLKVVTPWSYGAGGINLAQRQDGYLRAIETYSSDDGPEAAIERVSSYLPSCMVQFTGDEPESLSNIPGTFYRDVLSFTLLIMSQNLRYAPNATQGPRDSVEALDDPGVYRIIGDVRRVLHGLSFVSGLMNVERIEVGGSELGFEDLDRRVYVWQLAVKVRASYEITDEDLVAPALRLQPALTECWPLAKFDKLNYVAVGGGFDEGPGPGLTRTIEATIAIVGGAGCSAPLLSHTFLADSDTYRDLSPLGVWTFTPVAAGAPPPPLISGQLRVAKTRSDATAILSDVALCSFSVPYGDPIDLTP